MVYANLWKQVNNFDLFCRAKENNFHVASITSSLTAQFTTEYELQMVNTVLQCPISVACHFTFAQGEIFQILIKLNVRNKKSSVLSNFHIS